MTSRRGRWFGVALAVVLGVTTGMGCGATAAIRNAPRSAPLAREDGWAVATAESEGVAPERLEALEADLRDGRYHAPDAVLIARHGKLVYEQYWNGYGAARPHDLRSATKSVTSALIGIAIDRGALASVERPVTDAFPEATDKAAITVEHLLTMRSGLACDDWDPASPGQEERMYASADWRRFVLGLPILEAPGGTARYCTGGVVLLGGVLAKATGKDVPAFAREALFAPLGVEGEAWQPAPPDGTDTGGHLALRPRDFAKLGQLFLDHGRWAGRQVVSEAWVERSTQPRGPLGDSQFGYLWWVNTFTVAGTPHEAFFARGNGGQYLFVFPAQGLVAVFTGSHYDDAGSALPIELVARYVLAGLSTTGP